MLCDAPRMDLKNLSRRADRISDVFDPEHVDESENQIVEDRETKAWAKTELWMVDQHDGSHKGGFVLPEAQAEMLRTALEAISAPQVMRNEVSGGRRPGQASALRAEARVGVLHA